MRKGIELPVNVLVIVAIAVIVLLGMVALYMGGFTPFVGGVSKQAALNDGCQQLVAKGCNVSCATIWVNFDVNGDGKISHDVDSSGKADNLGNLTADYFGASGDAACKKLCNCPGYV